VSEHRSSDRLLAMPAGATAWLERHIERPNGFNVFLVLDGDTGTITLLTTQAAVQAAREHAPASTDRLMHAAARGTLMGHSAARTPALLPVLREAGVVAAGGEEVRAARRVRAGPA
jgi:dihydroxyacetone kinase-like predicted kinase